MWNAQKSFKRRKRKPPCHPHVYKKALQRTINAWPYQSILQVTTTTTLICMYVCNEMLRGTLSDSRPFFECALFCGIISDQASFPSAFRNILQRLLHSFLQVINVFFMNLSNLFLHNPYNNFVCVCCLDLLDTFLFI